MLVLDKCCSGTGSLHSADCRRAMHTGVIDLLQIARTSALFETFDEIRIAESSAILLIVSSPYLKTKKALKGPEVLKNIEVKN